MLEGKKILLGISGGIAAYKSASLIRLFRKAGAEVKVVVTQNALEFITRVTLETLSQQKVYSDVFSEQNDYTSEHVSLTDWGEIFVVAPATANIIGKYACGIADDALSTSLMAFDKQVIFAPAMNYKMYENFALQQNINFLKTKGAQFVEPSEGFLACGYEGKGRMEEPENIFCFVEDHFKNNSSLKGKKVLVTAGPTYESIDPVRYIGNHSSGIMGFELAREFAKRDAEVNLVAGPVKISESHPKIKRFDVVSAKEMYDCCMDLYPEMDITVMAAAVSDFTPEKAAGSKIKKEEKTIELKLKRTKDILAEMGQKKKKNQILAGFALETDDELENAKKKLDQKNLDMIVLNSLKDDGAGFMSQTNKITILDNNKQLERYDLKSKKSVAVDIVNYISRFITK